MAKTASQIVAERKEVSDYRNAVHEKQMAEVGAKAAARTAAVLNAAGHQTTTNPKTYEVSIVGTTTPKASTPKTATEKKQDLQYKKEKQTESKKKANAASDKYHSAKKAYETYTKSDEYRQRLEENDKKAKRQEVVNYFLPPEMWMAPKVIQDDKEIQLRAAMEQAEQEYKAAEENEIIEEDLEAITGLSNDDRQELEQYAVNQIRDQNLPVEFQNMPFFKTAEQEASGLIGKVGKQRADELTETYMRKENAQLAEQAEEAGQKFAEERPVIASAATVPINLMSGIVGTVGQLQGAARATGRYTSLDPNETGTALDKFSGSVREQVAQDIEGENPGFVGKAGSVLYQGGMSFLDSTARMLASGGVSGVSSAIAALGGFSQSLQKYSAMGASPEKAALAATAAAGLEYITDKLPTDEVLKIFHKGGSASAVKEVLKQAFVTEPLGEEINLFAGIAAEALILGEKSGKAQRIGDLIAGGMTKAEAEKQFWKETFAEAAETYAVSAVAGGLGAGSASIAGRQVQQGQEQQQTLQEETDAQVQQEALPTIPEEPDLAQLAMEDTAAGLQGNVPAAEPAAPMNDQQQNLQMAMEDLIGGQDPQEQTTKAVTNPIESYPPEKQNMIRSYIQAVDTKIKDFVQKVKGGDNTFKRQRISDVNDRAANDIGRILGIDVKGFTHNINTNGIQHIINRHTGKTGGHDNTMELVDDIARVGWVLENYDNVELLVEDGEQVYSSEFRDKNDNPAPQIRFVKKIDGYYYVVEAACENKHNKLWVQSAYLQKNNGDVTQAPAEGLSANHETNARSALASPSPIDIVSENTQEVNGNSSERQVPEAKTSDSNVNASASSPQTEDSGTMPAEGGQIKGTGAAEANFSGKPAYNATLSEDNAQADRAGDARPMELPRHDVHGGNASAVTGNVYGSLNTPDDLAAAMEEPTARGDYSYVRITNDAATQRARQSIGEAGSWETARDNFRMDVDKGNSGAELTARGALILNHAAEVYQQAKESGDVQAANKAKKEWLTILSDVQKLGTNTAQGLQALKIIRNLIPQDKVQFMRIAVKNMVRDMRLNADIRLDEQLLTDYENATTDQQRDEIMDKIQQNVADQIPSTVLDKWNALRYTNMLGNLKTTVRNVAGNMGNAAVYRMKDTVGAVLEAVAHKVSRGKTGRTKSIAVNGQLRKACDDYYRQVKNAISSGGKYGENNSAADDFAQSVMDKRRIFKSNSGSAMGNLLWSPLEGYRKATNWMMNNRYFGDEAFGKAAFTRAMAGYLQANGIKTEADFRNASPELMDQAVTYAVKEAQEATFHDNTALANVLGKLKKDTGIVGEGLNPFTKTPANVLVRAEEYSPLGILNTAVMSAQKAAGGTKLADGNGKIADWAAKGQDITGTDIINSLSKSLTGAGIFALGAILKNQGILNGGPDDDEEQAAFDEMNGNQPYSINLPGGKTYTLDWLTPAAMPLFMGAQLMDIAGRKDLTFADLEQVFTSIADPMLQMSMLQGMNDSLENIRYSENNLGQFFINAAVSYLTQGLTNTLMGQLERTTEENRQTTYIDKDSQIPQWMQRQLGKASQKIPGWDYQQMDYRNAWGQTEKNEEGLAYNLLSPGYISTKKDDDLTKELNRLRETTGENVFPQAAAKTISYLDNQGNNHVDYNLSRQELETLQTAMGETAARILEDLRKKPNYQALTDSQKAKAMLEVQSYAGQTGEIAAVKDHYGYSESWMQEIKPGKEADVFLQRSAVASVDKAMSNLKTAWAEGWDTKEREQQLKGSYEVYKDLDAAGKKAVIDAADAGSRDYITARNGGISHDVYLNTVKAIEKLRPETADTKNANQKQKMEAIAKQPGLTEEQRVLVGKLYGSEAQDENMDEVAALTRALKAEGKAVPGIPDFRLYTELYRDHEDYTHGNGKKNRTTDRWAQKYGISKKTAEAYYELFS